MSKFLHFRIFLLFLLFGALPFQKPISKHFDRLSERIVPSDLQLPAIFYKQIFFYPSDLFLLLFGVLTLWAARNHLKEFFLNGPSKYLLLFFSTCLLSILCSPSSHYLLPYFRLAQFSVFVLFFLSFRFFLLELPNRPLSKFRVRRFFGLFWRIFDFQERTHIRHVDMGPFLEIENTLKITEKTTEPEFRKRSNVPAFFKQLFFVILFAALFQVGMASVQLLTKASIGLKCLGEQNVRLFTFMQNDQGVLALRPSGSFMHPNILGGFLFFAIFSTLYLVFCETQKWRQILLSLALLILVGGLLTTLSKSALLAFLISFVLFIGLLIRMHHISYQKVFLKSSSIVLSLIASFLLLAPLIKAKGGFITSTPLSKACNEERILYQKVAWQMHKDSPWFGVGFSQYQLISPQYQPKDYPHLLYSKVHNIFLLILAETGVFGLTSFMLFLTALFLEILPKNAWQASVLSSVFLVILIGFLFIGLCDFYLWDGQPGKILFFTTLASLAPTRSRSLESCSKDSKKHIYLIKP